MEVMGLMLGEFVDDYTVRVIDVFAMPQTGTVSIFKTFSRVFESLEEVEASTDRQFHSIFDNFQWI